MLQQSAIFTIGNSATINADNFNVTVGDGFYNGNNATIHTDNFNVTAGSGFSNYNRLQQSVRITSMLQQDTNFRNWYVFNNQCR